MPVSRPSPGGKSAPSANTIGGGGIGSLFGGKKDGLFGAINKIIGDQDITTQEEPTVTPQPAPQPTTQPAQPATQPAQPAVNQQPVMMPGITTSFRPSGGK